MPDNPVDGRNVWPWISGQTDAVNPNTYYPLTIGNRFQGILTGDGRWKLHLEHGYRTLVRAAHDGAAGTYRQATIQRSLYDLEKDPLERTNVLERYPEVAARLLALADQHRRTFFP